MVAKHEKDKHKVFVMAFVAEILIVKRMAKEPFSQRILFM